MGILVYLFIVYNFHYCNATNKHAGRLFAFKRGIFLLWMQYISTSLISIY